MIDILEDYHRYIQESSDPLEFSDWVLKRMLINMKDKNRLKGTRKQKVEKDAEDFLNGDKTAEELVEGYRYKNDELYYLLYQIQKRKELPNL